MSEIRQPGNTESPNHDQMVQELARGTQEAVDVKGAETSPLPEGNNKYPELEEIRASIKEIPDTPEFVQGMNYTKGKLNPQEHVLVDQHNTETSVLNNPVREERGKKGFLDGLRGSWPARKVMLWASVIGIGGAAGHELSNIEPVQKGFDASVSYAKTAGEEVISHDVARDGLGELYDGAQQILQGGPEEVQGAENRATAASIETKKQNNKVGEILANTPNATEEEVNAQLEQKK